MQANEDPAPMDVVGVPAAVLLDGVLRCSVAVANPPGILYPDTVPRVADLVLGAARRLAEPSE